MRAAVIALVLLAGCGKNPEQSQRVNASFTVDTLFTKDGCTVYRFYDAGSPRYFTNCSGSTSYRVPAGKSQTRPEEIPGGRP
jgi:uncharacterized lipoprotein